MNRCKILIITVYVFDNIVVKIGMSIVNIV